MKNFNLETISKAYDSDISKNVIDRLLKQLSDCVGVYGCDLHGCLFNEESFYVMVANAEKDLDELGVFNCIKLVREYEKFNFGEFNTPIDPVRIANMVCYIMGGFINNSEHLTNNCWGDELTEKDLEIIEDELQTYLESLDEDLSNVAFDEWGI